MAHERGRAIPERSVRDGQEEERLVVIPVLFSACMFVAILCDDYFVPCLEKICEGKERRHAAAAPASFAFALLPEGT